PTDKDEAIKTELEEYAFQGLLAARHLVPIQEHEDWREALIVAYRKFKFNTIISNISVAYEQYLMHTETGVGFPPPERGGWYTPEGIKEYKMQILQMRKLAGESEDFNY
ncbi:MAG TPA: hypothetical protein VF411_13730, partial [Bacteroidia bacterium]